MNWMRVPVFFIAMLSATTAWGADIPAPDTAPPPGQPPAEQSKPEIAPSPTDPGLAKQPETVPDPNSVVTPPVVDPKMAINPEASPPQPAEPKEHRPNQDQPPKKQ